ncbi:hypothetical protein [Synechococcus elongatus]|uniref:hypothetical protein n=1 Tax=Synechococcus elongatus TaxID=32046 RepID=UPI000F7F463A|nr:hypothetical protein [Synechococcus elongatus]
MPSSLPEPVQRILQGSDTSLDQELRDFQAWSQANPDWDKVVTPITPPPQQEFDSTEALFAASHQGWRRLLPVDRTPLYAVSVVATVLVLAVALGSQLVKRSPPPAPSPTVAFQGPDLSQREFADLSLDRLSQINPEGRDRPRFQLFVQASPGQDLTQLAALIPGSEVQGDRLLVGEFRDRQAATARQQQFRQQGYSTELKTAP